MIQFYYNLAPNPMKVALALEEMGLAYEAMPVDTRKGEQHAPAFLRINPNAKVPAIVDGGETVFDSNAILLYLAEKTGQFLPGEKGQGLSWLMFIASGLGPFSGQCVHFRMAAPEPKEYALNRYVYEAQRHWGIIEQRLAGREWMVGNAYSIVDMALWGWSRLVPFVLGEEQARQYPNVARHREAINARPAAQKALAIKDRHAFKTENDEAAKNAMFRHLTTKVI